MPHSSTGVFDAGTSGNLDAAKAACRRQAVVQRAKLADASPDAAIMLASHAERIAGRYGSGVFAGYMPIHSELSPLALLKNLVGSWLRFGIANHTAGGSAAAVSSLGN